MKAFGTVASPDTTRPVVAGLIPATRKPIKHRQEDARQHIAYWVLGAYLALLVINIGVPLGLYIAFRPHQSVTVSDTKDLIVAISSAMGSLVGVMGFVVGYYFKSRDKNN
ncbi:hypothetical protein [Leekyejoonella antrihumi]|uniref:Uncharacterized protein n=1 Tax=Leekyejoonella antrihumi TaxID=1660198 RepID=A0A563DTV2_9MICO|nr:hypothetical protein [Leekyejoonella antrihumi]TWP33606.1 hypothetical protein FGL98_20475 [Leekyejoonella antrihumi]